MTDLETIIIVIVIAVAIYFIAKHFGWITSSEGYINNTLSAVGYMKRTPVTYAYIGDGLSGSPHYQANPGDSRAPLKWQNFYDSSREVGILPPTTTEPLVNDSKLRMDMLWSGDMYWHRVLNNMAGPNNGYINTDRRLESDDIVFDPKPPLYSPCYHYGEYVGY